MLYQLALSILWATIKNPKKAEPLKRELLELRDAITAQFPDEPKKRKPRARRPEATHDL